MTKHQKNFVIALQVCSIVFLIMFAAPAHGEESRPQRTGEHGIVPPPAPMTIQVDPTLFVPFFKGHGVGTQNYICKPTSPTTVAFALFTPQATLFNENGKQLTTHFFSPNPDEANTDPTVIGNFQIRATWQDSRDTSSVWAKVDKSATFLTDPAFVAPDAIAWLKLEVEGHRNGPTGDDTLKPTKFIQRVNTVRGLAPSTGCTSLSDIGNQAFVPYEADYIFYKSID
jgi:Protein of unknown function (DUF3455)